MGEVINLTGPPPLSAGGELFEKQYHPLTGTFAEVQRKSILREYAVLLSDQTGMWACYLHYKRSFSNKVQTLAELDGEVLSPEVIMANLVGFRVLHSYRTNTFRSLPFGTIIDQRDRRGSGGIEVVVELDSGGFSPFLPLGLVRIFALNSHYKRRRNR